MNAIFIENFHVNIDICYYLFIYVYSLIYAYRMSYSSHCDNLFIIVSGGICDHERVLIWGAYLFCMLRSVV